MEQMRLEEKIKERGRRLLGLIADETPSVFKRDWWAGKAMELAMADDDFKVRLFRFVDVLPCLTTDASLARHVEEYFSESDLGVAKVLRWGLGSGFTAKILATTLRHNIEKMARQFIIGADLPEARTSLNRLRERGFAFSVDILGEASVSEKEAEQYQDAYLTLLAALAKEQHQWPGLDSDSDLDWGCAPKINISVKSTSLYSQADPADWQGSVEAIQVRLKIIVLKAKEAGAFVCIDMEQYRYKDLVLEIYRRLRSDAELRDYPHLGIVLQTYLRDTEEDLDRLLAWARAEGLPISIRLVKGAYWDYETVIARQNGWPMPVYLHKAESDGAYERLASTILANHDICHLACASHNVRTIAAVMELAAAHHTPPERYEFQLLYGMAGPVQQALAREGKRIRLYSPYGELLPGMAYLVRRLLENTSNDSFLRQRFVEGADVAQLLANPVEVVARLKEEESAGSRQGDAMIAEPAPFSNEPLADFSRPDLRSAFPRALVRVREQLGQTYPLLINGQEVQSERLAASLNPANPQEIIGQVCQAGRPEVDQAIAAAREALPAWRDTPARDRAHYLFRAADLARRDIVTLAAWQVLEVGKQWGQTYADVAEAIDFLEYYGREMIRLEAGQNRPGQAPGELNHYLYEPRGLAAVIAPWNFPLAISTGMCAAALVAGNCVLFKPAGLAAVVGFRLAEIFRQAGLPDGVFNFIPGRGSEIGDYLVDHPRINLIAFTGSMEVGLRIAERGSRVSPGQSQVKKIIAEMGGKNAIIVDDDADLDQAIVQVLHSAFAYQGQKCSACSRVIILAGVYDKFVERLLDAARSLRIGPAEEPANFLGPVVDEAARQKILRYIEIGKEEGTLLLSRTGPAAGYYAPLTIFGDIRPEQRLAQEESSPASGSAGYPAPLLS
jgi:RHH-type proline utilization regulon transcriptional repressor/proline dehydrogenase/delta 1-pyrroline-5-carboxylate dehydrogenase